MSRPNTRSKLKKRIIRILTAASEPLSSNEVEARLKKISEERKDGYPCPDYAKIRAALADLLSAQRIERLEPNFPPGVEPYSNRELQIVWAQYTRYRIPTLNRLAMISDEEDE